MIAMTPSLGGAKTICLKCSNLLGEHPEIGLADNYIRLSVGLENPEDIIADLQQALDSLLDKT